MYEYLSPFFPAFVVFAGALVVAGGTFWGSYRQSNFNREIREKNREIAELQIEAARQITGGDSFLVTHFMLPNPRDASGQISPMYVPQGKYPLYDIDVRFYDIDRDDLPIEQRSTSFQLGNTIPAFAQSKGHVLQHRNSQSIRYNIFFGARNGGWIERHRQLWAADGWATAISVEKDGKQVYEEVTDNFPRKPDGAIDWDASTVVISTPTTSNH